MNKLWRLFYTLFIARFRTRVEPLGPCVTPFRAWPTDIDIFFHMTNSAYLAMMDLARTDLLLRSPLGKFVKDQGWYPVVAAQTIRYYNSIPPFAKYSIRTQGLGWEDGFFLLEQVFHHGNTTYAVAYVRGVFLRRGGGGKVPSEEIVSALGIDKRDAVSAPDWVKEWNTKQKRPTQNRTKGKSLGRKLATGSG